MAVNQTAFSCHGIAGAGGSSNMKDGRAVVRVCLMCLCLLATGCAARFTGTPLSHFDSQSRLFASTSLSVQEREQILNELKKVSPQPQYIWRIYRDAPDKIQVLSLDKRHMKYGDGRTYNFKKTKAGWILDEKEPIYWSTC